MLFWAPPDPEYYDDWDGPPADSYEYRVRPAGGTYPSTWTPIPEFTGTIHHSIGLLHSVETLADGTALSNGTAYFFEMRSVNALGAGEATEEFPSAEDAVYSTPVANTPATYLVDHEVGRILRPEGGTVVPRAPALQTVSMVGAVEDANGITYAKDTMDSRFTWRWQWIRVRNGVETEIPGATNGMGQLGSAYTLTPADVGSQIKVRMRWRDESYNLEEWVSPAIGPILPAAACPAPNLAGGRTKLWSKQIELVQLDELSEDELRFGHGRLSNLTAGDYSISEVYHATEGTDAGKLVLKLGAEVSEEDQRQLALHVCDEVYPLIRDRDPLRNPTSCPMRSEPEGRIDFNVR